MIFSNSCNRSAGSRRPAPITTQSGRFDLSAAVVIQLVPMLAVVFLLQRHIVRGMTLGAVK